jgi:hypothetical protein
MPCPRKTPIFEVHDWTMILRERVVHFEGGKDFGGKDEIFDDVSTQPGPLPRTFPSPRSKAKSFIALHSCPRR